eukprot:Filipodium_phascolosomae@DN5468_c0_g1_i1.p1
MTDSLAEKKKRNEVLQMLMLNPDLTILDETDSGLDVDALRLTGGVLDEFLTKHKSAIVITHYKRLLEYVKPTKVHVLKNGKIVKTGGPELAHELESEGYQNFGPPPPKQRIAL